MKVAILMSLSVGSFFDSTDAMYVLEKTQAHRSIAISFLNWKNPYQWQYCQGLFQIFFGCGYHTLSSAPSFEKNNSLEMEKKHV